MSKKVIFYVCDGLCRTHFVVNGYHDVYMDSTICVIFDAYVISHKKEAMINMKFFATLSK